MFKKIIQIIGKPKEIKKDLVITAIWDITTQKALNKLKKELYVFKNPYGHYILTANIDNQVKRIDIFNGKGTPFKMIIKESDLKWI